MKTAIYIEDGVTQLVLTPENEWERSATNNIQSEPGQVIITRGGFYHCQGGWNRQNGNEDSLILRVEAKESP